MKGKRTRQEEGEEEGLGERQEATSPMEAMGTMKTISAGRPGGGGEGGVPTKKNAMKSKKNENGKTAGRPLIEFKVYEKRIHSLAYHARRSELLAAARGLYAANKAGAAAGKAATLKLRADTKSGSQLLPFVIRSEGSPLPAV